MRDVYKDEEIGLANHFEQEAKANGPTQKEKDLARALDDMASKAYGYQKEAKDLRYREAEAQRKAATAYKQGFDQATLNNVATIRHMNYEITGLKGEVTKKEKENKDLREENKQLTQVVNKVPELLQQMNEATNKILSLREERDYLVEKTDLLNNALIKEREDKKETEELLNIVLNEKEEMKNKLNDYERRFRLIAGCADLDRKLPGNKNK